MMDSSDHLLVCDGFWMMDFPDHLLVCNGFLDDGFPIIICLFVQ